MNDKPLSKRQLRKRERQEKWGAQVMEHEEWVRLHPVSSGKIKCEQYQEPKWSYTPPKPLRNGLEIGL